MAAIMPEKQYEKFKKILYDYGGFDPADVYNHIRGPAYEFRKAKLRKLDEFQEKHGRAFPEPRPGGVINEKKRKDWAEYYEITHAPMPRN